VSDWAPLRRYTEARIGQVRAGTSVSTQELLSFQLAHAEARDAVIHAWDVDACSAELAAADIDNLVVRSRAADRTTYLARPDLGRQLEPDSLRLLESRRAEEPEDVALVLSDGLSATAVQNHGVATIQALLESLRRRGLRCSPVVLVGNGRVALSDVIGHALGTQTALIVLGERPGLSAADSLGFYLTHQPKPGNTDAMRNCISNVREPGGLSPRVAAERIAALLVRAIEIGTSGIELKAFEPPVEIAALTR
jgi:ethanolamine ammonia-lyase small subunit